MERFGISSPSWTLLHGKFSLHESASITMQLWYLLPLTMPSPIPNVFPCIFIPTREKNSWHRRSPGIWSFKEYRFPYRTKHHPGKTATKRVSSEDSRKSLGIWIGLKQPEHLLRRFTDKSITTTMTVSILRSTCRQPSMRNS